MYLGNKGNSTDRPEPSSGVLYVVGTPIGNLGDLSPRAESLLKKVSFIACEDTRRSGQLLRKLGAKAPLISFYQHNTQSRIPHLLKLLKQGESLAIISDAGLPGISDPGENLVSIARDNGHEVICIPGPCAATTALASSGLPSNRFCFEGFLPLKAKDRNKSLEEISKETRTIVIYEAPHRLINLLQDLKKLCGHERPLQIAKELTKRYEEQIGPNIGESLKYFEKNKPIGEFTLVLGGASSRREKLFTNQELIEQMNALIQNGISTSDAARILAKEKGCSRKFIYDLIHKKDH